MAQKFSYKQLTVAQNLSFFAGICGCSAATSRRGSMPW
jgi:ABC-type multidrug transport system ATPase subunit